MHHFHPTTPTETPQHHTTSSSTTTMLTRSLLACTRPREHPPVVSSKSHPNIPIRTGEPDTINMLPLPSHQVMNNGLILSAIFQHVARRDLVGCMRVNSDWRSAATPILYASVSETICEGVWERCETSEVNILARTKWI
jgi:hypothetical protein